MRVTSVEAAAAAVGSGARAGRAPVSVARPDHREMLGRAAVERFGALPVR